MVLPEFYFAGPRKNGLTESLQQNNLRESWMSQAQRRQQQEQEFEIMRPVLEAEARLQQKRAEDNLSAMEQMRTFTSEARGQMPAARLEHESLFRLEDPQDFFREASRWLSRYSHLDRVQEVAPEVAAMGQALTREMDRREFLWRKQQEMGIWKEQEATRQENRQQTAQTPGSLFPKIDFAQGGQQAVVQGRMEMHNFLKEVERAYKDSGKAATADIEYLRAMVREFSQRSGATPVFNQGDYNLPPQFWQQAGVMVEGPQRTGQQGAAHSSADEYIRNLLGR